MSPLVGYLRTVITEARCARADFDELRRDCHATVRLLAEPDTEPGGVLAFDKIGGTGTALLTSSTWAHNILRG